MALLKQQVKRRLNKAITALPTYHEEIPLDQLDGLLKEEGGLHIVDEDGSPWQGLLLGESAMTTFPLRREGEAEDITNAMLIMSWYKMTSGRYEIVAYVG